MAKESEVLATSKVKGSGFLGMFGGKRSLSVTAKGIQIQTGREQYYAWEQIESFDIDSERIAIQVKGGNKIALPITRNPHVAGLAWMMWNYRSSKLFTDIGTLDFRLQSTPLILRSFLRDEEVVFRDAGTVLEHNNRRIFLPSARTIPVREVQSIGGMKMSGTTVDFLRFHPEPSVLPLATICFSIISSDMNSSDKENYLQLLVENHGAGWESEPVHGLAVSWN